MSYRHWKDDIEAALVPSSSIVCIRQRHCASCYVCTPDSMLYGRDLPTSATHTHTHTHTHILHSVRRMFRCGKNYVSRISACTSDPACNSRKRNLERSYFVQTLLCLTAADERQQVIRRSMAELTVGRVAWHMTRDCCLLT